MYDNEEELNEPLSRIFHVTIINPLKPKVDIAQKILAKTSYEYKDRLKFNYITNIKNLLKPTSEIINQNASKGLIDTNWLKDINQNPCLILMYYHIEQKDVNLEAEELKIYNLLQEIKKDDNNINIFLFIIYKDYKEDPENPICFLTEDKFNKHNLRNL